MKKKTTSLFLLELILAILIFFMAAAICVSMFAKAHEMNKKSQELNSAVLAEKNLAEALSRAVSMDDACSLVTAMYPEAEISAAGDSAADQSEEDDMTVTIPLDGDFQSTAGQEAYLLTADLSQDGNLLTAELHMYPADDEEEEAEAGSSVYDLTVENALSAESGTAGSGTAGSVAEDSAAEESGTVKSVAEDSTAEESGTAESAAEKSGTEEAAS